MRIRFSPKLRLAMLWPAVAALLGATVLLFLLLPGLFADAAATQLLTTVEALAANLPAPALRDQETLHDWCHRTARPGLRVTVVDPRGRVVADSARTFEELAEAPSYLGRPEIQQALREGSGRSVRRSTTTGLDSAYAARRVGPPDGEELLLRAAFPLEGLAAVRARLTGTMVAALVLAVLLITLVSLWIDRKLFRPLAGLIEGANHLARGELDHRLPIPEEDELARLAAALNRLAGRARAQIAEVGSERDHLQAILGAMSEGVLVLDGKGRIELANAALRRLFDLPEEPAGRSIFEVVRLAAFRRLVERALESGSEAGEEIELPGPEPRSLAVTVSRLPGRPAWMVVARDLTPFARLAAVRRDFVANVSHELKTPLSAIRGYAETLRDGAAAEPDTADRFLERILDQCGRLQLILDDLLTLSRLETEEAPRERRPVDVAQLARQAIETVSGLAREKETELVLEAPPRAMLEGDPEGLERLLVNLLENAIKYNRPGGRVDVRLDHGDSEVVLSVTDTGIGIPAGALERIFERFYRVDKGRSRQEGGTGLGLAIVKHVAQSHGGRVEVESRVGEGSTFRVVFPR